MSLPSAATADQQRPQPNSGQRPLVQVRDLRKTFVLGKSLVRQLLGRRPAYLRALDGVSLDIQRGEA